MQEYEQHLIGLAVKSGSKKEQRFHPYKKSKRGRGGRQQAPHGVYYQPMRAPQYMVQRPFFQPPPQGGHRGGEDTQYQVLPSQNPGVELTMLSGDPLHCVFPVAPPEREKTLSVLSLLEREKTLCVQSPPEREKTLGVQSQDISNLVQFKSVYIQEKAKDLPVGGQIKAVPSGVGKTWVPPVDHRVHKRRIQVALQGTPKPIQGTLHNQ